MNSSDMSAIRHQMDETRTALTDKLERLEKQVTNTVQGAAQSVGDTVENVKHAIDDTVHNVTASVQNVKDSFQDTMHAVGEAFSISHHVERHPWTMVAGATAVGFVAGYVMTQRSGDARAERKFRHLAASQGRVPESDYEPVPQYMPQPTRAASSSTMHHMKDSNGSNAFMEWLRPATSQIQALAVGAALGLLRDMIKQSVPPAMTPKVTELVNGLTTSLGGQVVQENLVEQFKGMQRKA